VSARVRVAMGSASVSTSMSRLGMIAEVHEKLYGMWCANGGAVMHKMCVESVWRACKSALTLMICDMRVWRACKSSLSPLTCAMVCGVRVRVHIGYGMRAGVQTFAK